MGRRHVDGFTRGIQVDRNLVRLLSQDTYTSFANCIRELVVNAYDADATRVDVTFARPVRAPGRRLPKYCGQITIRDDGTGMSQQDFVQYSRIAPGRPSKTKTKKYQRDRVGRFGIGYLAAFPFCETLELRTKSADSTEVLFASFNCSAYLAQTESFKNIEEVPVEARVERIARPIGEHWTSITLVNLSESARAHLIGAEASSGKRVESIRHWQGLAKLRWELGQILPIDWGPYESWRRDLGMKPHISDPGFKVYVDEEELTKPWGKGSRVDRLDLHNVEKSVVRVEKPDSVAPEAWPDDKSFLYKYAVFALHAPIEPKELRGFQIRIKGVGIGTPYRYSELPSVVNPKELIRLTVEVNLISGFESELTLDRSQLKSAPWVTALLESLSERILPVARKYGKGESRAQRFREQLKKGGSGAPSQTLVRKLADAASLMRYTMEQWDRPEIEIGHSDRTIYYPAPEALSATMPIFGEEYSITEGTAGDEQLARYSVMLDTPTRQIRVAPSLWQIVSGRYETDRKYRELLRRLALVEYRLQQASDHFPDAVAALRSLANLLKKDLVDEVVS